MWESWPISFLVCSSITERKIPSPPFSPNHQCPSRKLSLTELGEQESWPCLSLTIYSIWEREKALSLT